MNNTIYELFKVLPDKVFAPLASANKHRYWFVLCSLYTHRFGPESEAPPIYGYKQTDIFRYIETLIEYGDVWDNEEGESSDTPLSIRAANIFNRLTDAGWFTVETHVTKYVSMRPVVTQFLSTLINFAEKGPVFVSGKMRSIASLIEQVLNEKASGDALKEAAEQSRNLIQHIQNTGINVRELMASLDPKSPTSTYVRSFFEGYIEQYFIGDYKLLKTQDHPLAKRSEVIENIEILSVNPEYRNRLIAWYSQNITKSDQRTAVNLFERDIQKIMALSDINIFLDRLDEELRRANRRALSVLTHIIKSSRPLDDLITQAIYNLTQSSEQYLPTAFPHASLMSGSRLYEQRGQLERQKADPIRKKVPSDREIAIARIHQRVREARSVSHAKLSAFVDRTLSENEVMTSDQIKIETIEDIRAYQTLQMTAMLQSTNSPDLVRESRLLARTFNTHTTGKKEMPHRFISGKPFKLTKK
jgi:tRNA splicing endonuclease